MINRVVLVGRLTREPELRYTPSGVPFTRFTLAVDRKFTNQNGQREADFINIIAWRGLAENAAKYLGKGSLCGVDGSIVTGKYETDDGRTVYTTDVKADEIRFLDTRRTNGERGGVSEADRKALDDMFADDGQPITIKDEDLPF